ncbi:MAG: TIGR04100 family radical SAM protein [Firmicutes bacterium]|nr:TIGR04100 family radical SAM protein [Bacillota bacterium]MDD7601735.1 TIGR04100 family radical SAM protein [Bacillota bacterium]MDY5855556.1 TIGR04100 family radical SAM protein [Anaerovoracaceae bacterium]
MEAIGDVLYDYASGLYANLTNRCPCRCEFCIRNMTDSLGDADSLWLKREPTVEEVKEMLGEWDLSKYTELVFCGYGEPMERLEDVLQLCRYVKETTHLKTRINTNGLSDLLHGRRTAPELSGLVDAISISLNAPSAEKYDRLCHPKFGLEAWPAILRFTEEVKRYVPDVTMSVVGGTIPEEDVEVCRQIAQTKLGVKFRVR